MQKVNMGLGVLALMDQADVPAVQTDQLLSRSEPSPVPHVLASHVPASASAEPFQFQHNSTASGTVWQVAEDFFFSLCINSSTFLFHYWMLQGSIHHHQSHRPSIWVDNGRIAGFMTVFGLLMALKYVFGQQITCGVHPMYLKRSQCHLGRHVCVQKNVYADNAKSCCKETQQ